MQVRKAVIAAAGLGTRFLPQTKAMPKEMLPIVDKPIIQYVVEELVAAGIKDIIIVSGHSKRSIEDHFDRPVEDLRRSLEKSGKAELLKQVEDIASLANFIYVRQKGPTGNASPLLEVEHLIGDEPFIYCWGDEFIESDPRQFVLMTDTYAKYNSPIVLTLTAESDEDYKRYGIYGGDLLEDGVMDVKNVIEKPGKDNAPSDQYSCGGFLLTPDIFPYIHKLKEGFDGQGELTIQKAYQAMIDDGHRMIAAPVKNGKFRDAGNKLEYLKTVVEFGIKNKDIGEDFKSYLRELTSREN